MVKRISLLLAYVGGIVYLYAQTPTNNAIQEINQVKSQPDTFLYAESTAVSWKEALDNAKYLLESEIESYIKQYGMTDAAGVVAKSQNHIFELQSMRGDRYRAFVYVRVSDIMTYSGTEQLLVVPVASDQQSSVQLMTSGEEPEASVPDNAQSAPIPQTEGAVVPVSPPTSAPSMPLTALEQSMLNTDAQHISDFIREGLAKGEIIAYGKYADMPQDVDCYLFVYNRDKKIVACLHKAGTAYTNLQTGNPDHITNYKGCGANWFQTK